MKLFRITLRDLFWLVLVIGMGLGWWLHARRLEAELARSHGDLAVQADFVQQFVSVVNQIGCEVPPESDPRNSRGGPYTRIFAPDYVTKEKGCLSFTLSGSRDQLQRALENEWADYRTGQ
jgi:hypothetical protein